MRNVVFAAITALAIANSDGRRAVCRRQKDQPELAEIRDLWEASLNNAKGGVNSMLGYPKEAEENYRTCVRAIRAYLARPKAAEQWHAYLHSEMIATLTPIGTGAASIYAGIKALFGDVD